MSIDFEALHREIKLQAFAVLKADFDKIANLTFKKDFRDTTDWLKFLRGNPTPTQLMELAVHDHLNRSETTRWGLDREGLVDIVSRTSGVFDRVQRSTPENRKKNGIDFILHRRGVITIASVKNSENGLNSDSTSGFIVNADSYAEEIARKNPDAEVDILLFALRGTRSQMKKHDYKEDGKILRTVCVPVIVGADAWLFFSGLFTMNRILARIETTVYESSQYMRAYQYVEERRQAKIEALTRDFKQSGFYANEKIDKEKLILIGETVKGGIHRKHARLRHIHRHRELFCQNTPITLDIDHLPPSSWPGHHLNHPVYVGATKSGKAQIQWDIKKSNYTRIMEVDPWFVLPVGGVPDIIPEDLPKAKDDPLLEEFLDKMKAEDRNEIIDLFGKAENE